MAATNSLSFVSPETSILFLARELSHGGAERQLVLLASAMRQRGFDVAVATMYGGGFYEEELRAQGVPVHPLAKRGRWDIIGFAARLRGLLRKTDPHILHSYLVVPNILASSMRMFHPSTRVVWGVRASHLEWAHYDYATRLTFEVSRVASRMAHRIIVNSVAGKSFHVAQGYPADRMIVVPNGIDTTRFFFDAEARRRLRREWQVAETAPVIGMIGRLDPMKGHTTFLQAAARVLATRRDARFLVVGGGEADYLRSLQDGVRDGGIADAVRFVGAVKEIPPLYSGLDVLVSASEWGEGFPNVVGEAMASELNCVVTDCGDSAHVVGDTGIVIPPRDPEALARGIMAVLSWDEKQRRRNGCQARSRIERHFSVESLVEQTIRALESLG